MIEVKFFKYTMTNIEELIKSIQTGQEKFLRIWNLSDAEIKDYIISLTFDKYDDILRNPYRCIRTIVDGKPESIKLCFHDTISINFRGIRYEPKMILSDKIQIIKFDENFNL